MQVIMEQSIVEELATPLTINNDSQGSESPDPMSPDPLDPLSPEIPDESLDADETNNFTINFKFEDEPTPNDVSTNIS